MTQLLRDQLRETLCRDTSITYTYFHFIGKFRICSLFFCLLIKKKKKKNHFTKTIILFIDKILITVFMTKFNSGHFFHD